MFRRAILSTLFPALMGGQAPHWQALIQRLSPAIHRFHPMIVLHYRFCGMDGPIELIPNSHRTNNFNYLLRVYKR